MDAAGVMTDVPGRRCTGRQDSKIKERVERRGDNGPTRARSGENKDNRYNNNNEYYEEVERG